MCGFETPIWRNYWNVSFVDSSYRGCTLLSGINLIVGVLLSYSHTYSNWPKMDSQKKYGLALIMQELKTKRLFIVSPFYTTVRKICQAEIYQDKNTVATFLNKRVKLLCFTWNNSWSQTLTDEANLVDLIQVNYISVASKYLISPANITWQGRLAARRIMTSCQKSHKREKLKKKFKKNLKRELLEEEWCINKVCNLDMGDSQSCFLLRVISLYE